MTAMKWFYSFLKKHNRSMILGLLLVTIISILAIVKPIVSGAIVDDVITAGDYEMLPKLIALLILITILRGVLRFWSQVIFESCSQNVLYTMRDTVYRKLLQEDFNFYNKKRTGDLLSRQTDDIAFYKCFHASSSSFRSQSLARLGSLKNALLISVSSCRMNFTKARMISSLLSGTSAIRCSSNCCFDIFDNPFFYFYI